MKEHLKQLKANKKGFTLIEMIVVIAIIGILAAILVPSMAGYLSTAKDSKKEANARTVYTAAQAAVTSLEAASGTYTKNDGNTMKYTAKVQTQAEEEDNTAVKNDKEAEALFGKIKSLIGTSNYEKFSEIVVEVDEGAVTQVKVTDASGPATYPKSN